MDSGANDCRISGELSRLTLNPADGTWTNAENVLLTGWCQQYGSHSIGTVTFGRDGYPYVSSGDGASYNQVDTGNLGNERCSDPADEGGALRSQSPRRPAGEPTVLDGSVLRLDPDTGAAAPGNPFASDPSPIKQRIIGNGLRNPFRIATRPGTDEVWVAEVGWTSWEELNRIETAGAAENFGWSCYEGVGRQSGYDAAQAPLVNGPTWTAAGKYGGALTFDGVNDWVSVADSASPVRGSVRDSPLSGWTGACGRTRVES